MHRFRELGRELFAGKILATPPAGTSVLVQEWFSSGRVVKSLNHLGYLKFDKSRRQRGSPGRIAIAAAGDDRGAVAVVLQLIDILGFDATDAGTLKGGLALQPGGRMFGAGHSAKELSNLFRARSSNSRVKKNLRSKSVRLRPTSDAATRPPGPLPAAPKDA